MISSFYRFWLACVVVAVSGVVHAFWLAPDAWEGMQTVQAHTGSIGLWDYLRGAMALLPGLGLIVLWERSQKRSTETVLLRQNEWPAEREHHEQYEEEQVAA